MAGRKHVSSKSGSSVRLDPSRFRVLLIDQYGNALRQTDFEISFEGGKAKAGTTDANGFAEGNIPVGADKASLTIKTGKDAETWKKLELNVLGEIGKHGGRATKARLGNLGYPAGEIDGKPSEQLTKATAAFQKSIGHERSDGVLDYQTILRLHQLHDPE